MDIHIFNLFQHPCCLHLVFIFKKILEEDVFMYVCMKKELCGEGRKKAYVEQKLYLVAI